MQKIINDRPLFYCFLAFGFGVLFARPIFLADFISCLFFGLTLAVVTFLCFKYKKFVSFCLIIISLLVGFLSYFISENSFNCKSYEGEVTILGRVCTVQTKEGNQSVILDEVFISGKKIDKCVYVYIDGCTEMEEGVVITFNGKLKNTSLFTLKKFNSYYYKYNVGYSSFTNLEEIMVNDSNNLSWAERLKVNVKYHLFKNMSQDEASISYASLFGDKTYIPSEVKQNFSVSGMAHMLAVSGLHIGFLVAVLTFLLKLLKINKYYKLAILTAFLGIYCYLCGFSASVVRASIMFLIFSLSEILGKKYDRLNSWGIAGIICLFIRPLSVYDGGFLLSFACVLCIFMFAKPLAKKLKSWHLPKSLASSFGVIIPVQFGLLPLMSLFFTKTSILSLVANLICVPLFELFFILLFFCLPLVLVLPIFSFILFVPKIIIKIIIGMANYVASLNFAIINLTMLTSIFVIGVYVCLFMLSHYLNLKTKPRFLSTWLIALICVTVVGYSSFKLAAGDQKLTVLNSYSQVYVLELNNKTYAIGNFDNNAIKLTENFLYSSRLYFADYYIAFNSVVPINEKDCFKNIYCPAGDSNKIKLCNNSYLTPINIGGVFVGILIETTFQKYLFCAKNITNMQAYELYTKYQEIDFAVGEDKDLSEIQKYITIKNVLKDGKTIYNKNSNQTINKTGNFTISLKQDKILSVRGVD